MNEVPTFRAHKVELATSMNQRSRYKVVDETGDAVVIEITNNENRPIHVCVISYQADGSIVILYPPKKASGPIRNFQSCSHCSSMVILSKE